MIEYQLAEDRAHTSLVCGANVIIYNCNSCQNDHFEGVHKISLCTIS